MSRTYFLLPVFALFLLLQTAHAEENAIGPIAICEDDTEVFPMTYYSRESNRKDNKLIGFTVELIERIFYKHKISWDIVLIPWSRCLHEVKKGKKYQMLLNAVSNEQRRRDYYFTGPHFEAKNFYFYAKEKYPNGLPINSPADLSNYVLGGVYGYDQTVFGIKEEQVLIHSKSLPKLIQMMYLGRFDVFMAGSDAVPWMRKAFPELNIDTRLGYAPLKETEGTYFHMMLSKQWPQAKKVQTLLNKEMALMQESGEWQTLLDKYEN